MKLMIPLFLPFLCMAACASSSSGTSAASSTANLEALCDPQAKCEDWNTSKAQSCKNDKTDLGKKATAQGCQKQLDAYVSCFSNRATCIAGKYDVGGCQAETDSITKCANGSGGTSGTSGGTSGTSGGTSGTSGGTSGTSGGTSGTSGGTSGTSGGTSGTSGGTSGGVPPNYCCVNGEFFTCPDAASTQTCAPVCQRTASLDSHCH